MLLEGLHIPLTTPFHPDGRLNTPKLSANVARYSKTPAAGLIVLGPNDEPTMLSDDETREVFRTASQSATPEKVLLAGIPRDSVRNTLALADFAAEQRYDAILVGVPWILASNEQVQTHRLSQVLLHFQTIADGSPLPVVLLNSPGRGIPIDAVVELAAHPNILGLLDDAGTETHSFAIAEILKRTAPVQREVTVTPTFAAVTGRMLAVATRQPDASLLSAVALKTSAAAIAEPPPAAPPLRTRTKSVGFQIIAGRTSAMLNDLRRGASAIAPAFATCAPQACYEVFAAWKDDDHPLAEEKQLRLNPAARLAEALGPGGLKFACDLNGYFGGRPRLPLLPPSGAERAEIEQLMKGML
jgi:dihydrodipicolinate synthase/N-acetylneuraminate lyase